MSSDIYLIRYGSCIWQRKMPEDIGLINSGLRKQGNGEQEYVRDYQQEKPESDSNAYGYHGTACSGKG